MREKKIFLKYNNKAVLYLISKLWYKYPCCCGSTDWTACLHYTTIHLISKWKHDKEVCYFIFSGKPKNIRAHADELSLFKRPTAFITLYHCNLLWIQVCSYWFCSFCHWGQLHHNSGRHLRALPLWFFILRHWLLVKVVFFCIFFFRFSPT